MAWVYERTCDEDSFTPLFSSIYFDREVERKEEPQSQRGVARESHSASHLNITLDEKRSLCVRITAASSFLSGKSIGHCGVACVIINNNLPLTQTLGNLCSRICDLRTIESGCISSHSPVT